MEIHYSNVTFVIKENVKYSVILLSGLQVFLRSDSQLFYWVQAFVTHKILQFWSQCILVNFSS